MAEIIWQSATDIRIKPKREMKMLTRVQKILAIAKANAVSGKDQDQIDDYEDNMRDTIAGIFPDWTADEAAIAEAEFNRIVGRT